MTTKTPTPTEAPDTASLLTNDEAAALLRLAPRTLENWRGKRQGPRPTRLGGRSYYRREAIEAWLAAEEARNAEGWAS